MLATLAGELARNHRVTIVTPAAPGAAAWDGCVSYYVRRYRQGKTVVGKAFRMLVAAWPAAAAGDAVICGHAVAAPAAWFVSRVFRKPYFIYVHALEITAPRYRRLYRLLFRRARGIVAGSVYARQLVVDYLGLPAACVDVVEPAVTRRILEEAALNDDGLPYGDPARRVILTVGRLRSDERYKGHDTVIAALALVRSRIPNIVYWIVGDGDDRCRLEGLARDAGVADCVKFWGTVEDVAPFYRGCDLFVMPGRRVLADGRELAEGFGLVYLEAAAFGKPVVAGNCAGARDAVADGLTGLLVDPENAAGVAAAVVGLLADPAYAVQLGREAKRRVRAEHTPAAQAARFERAVAGRLARFGEGTS